MTEDRRAKIEFTFSDKFGNEVRLKFDGDARDFRPIVSDIAAASGGDIRPTRDEVFTPQLPSYIDVTPPITIAPVPTAVQPALPQALPQALPSEIEQYCAPPQPTTMILPPLPKIRRGYKYYLNGGISAMLTGITIGILFLFWQSPTLRKNLMSAINPPPTTPQKK